MVVFLSLQHNKELVKKLFRRPQKRPILNTEFIDTPAGIFFAGL